MKMRSKCMAAMAFSCLAIAGCDDDDEDDIVATGDYGYVGDEASWAGHCAALNYAMMDPIDDFDFSTDGTAAVGIPTANDLAAQSAAGVRAYFSPSSCVNASSAGGTATVILNGCNGPLGAQNMSGIFMTTFQQTSSGYSANLNATGVRIGGRTGQWQVAANVSPTDDGWSVTLTSNGTLTGLAGNSINRSAQATLSWVAGSGCVKVDGRATDVVNGTTYNANLSGYQHCTGSCPAAGTLIVDGPNQDVTVAFDGSSTPAMTSTTGVSTELQLACGS